MQILNENKLRYISETFRYQEIERKVLCGIRIIVSFSRWLELIRHVQYVFVHVYHFHLNICYVRATCLC
jgi:hypothetical protein